MLQIMQQKYPSHHLFEISEKKIVSHEIRMSTLNLINIRAKIITFCRSVLPRKMSVEAVLKQSLGYAAVRSVGRRGYGDTASGSAFEVTASTGNKVIMTLYIRFENEQKTYP